MALQKSITRLLFVLALVSISSFVSVTEASVFGLKTCGSGSPGFCGSGVLPASLAPSVLFIFSEDGSSLNNVGFVQMGGIDIDVDGLAASKNHDLLAFELIKDTNNENIVVGSSLVSIDKTNAVATSVGPELANRDIRGAAFDRNDRLWAIDTSGNELLEVDPTSGSVIGSPFPLTLDGNAFDVGSFTDLAIDINGIAVLSNLFDFFTIDLSNGNLSPFFQGVTSDGYAGLAYSAGARVGDIFTYDVQFSDDIYVYDETNTRNDLYTNIMAEFNAGRGDLAAIPGTLDLLYTPVKPCRIADTRNTSAGMIDANMQRDFRVFGDGGTISAQGGDPAGCPSPLGEPLAAHINMVAVDPTGKGNLKAFPVGASSNAGLSVNFNAIDTNLANAGTVKTIAGAGPDITVASNFSSAHVTIQVLGYYYPDGDLSYKAVTPCKIVDTRNTSEGMIGANTQRDFYVYGDGGTIGPQGGNPTGCPSPLGGPLAAHINMVAVNPTGKGNLKAFPKGVGATTGLSVNYNTIDTNLANAGTVNTNGGDPAEITVASNFSSAHVTVQVLGYYYEEGDLSYTPVTPCKIVDTRNTSEGMIDAGTQRCFDVFGGGGPIGAQGGNPAGCPEPLGAPPGGPLAAHINMVAVDPTGKGNLKAFPQGVGATTGLSVNYNNTIDTNLANAGTVKTTAGAGKEICVASNFSSAHVTIQVLGYYYPTP